MISEALFSDVMFYLVAFFMVVCAIATVSVKNILHSAIGLIATFFCTAILYLLLRAEFLAIAQVLVYIGGVVIFVVFTILLTSQLGEKALLTGKVRHGLAVVFALLFFATMAHLVLKVPAPVGEATATAGYASMATFGQRLLSAERSGFIIPFEAISLLLLASLIGAITIARKPHEDKIPGEK
jgi:NADH-quinone oxidoreductase subunit J